MKKGIIFDMDGTLVDSEKLFLIALKRTFPDLDMTHNELSLRFRGLQLATIFQQIETLTQQPLAKDIVTTYRRHYTDLATDGITAFPHVQETLTALGLPMCVASNAPMEKILPSLASAGLSNLFSDALYSAYDVQSWKPDPGLFLHASKALGIAPEHCIVIEDSQAGLVAAQAAGMKAIQYREPDTEQLADLHFNDYRQLPQILVTLGCTFD